MSVVLSIPGSLVQLACVRLFFVLQPNFVRFYLAMRSGRVMMKTYEQDSTR